MRSIRILLLPLLAALLAGGCGEYDDPILKLSSEEALAQGKRELEEENYRTAQRYLEHAFEVSPNSEGGREALLLAAQALYLDGGTEAWIRCESKYRDFLNRFPTSKRADFAQLQVGNCLFERMERPDRDQTVAEQALAAYEELLRLYPTSEYVDDAREKIRLVIQNLGESEFMVGEFYLSYGLCTAAIQRFAWLPERYPTYAEQDKALFYLGRAFSECLQFDRARETFEQLEREYPDSPWIAELPEAREELREIEEETPPEAIAAAKEKAGVAAEDVADAAADAADAGGR